MDYREKWLTLLRELGQFDINTIRKTLVELNSHAAVFGGKHFISINHDLRLFLKRGKQPTIEILRERPDSSGYSSIYSSSYYSPGDLDKLPIEIKEKVTQTLEDFYNRSKEIETEKGERKEIKVETYLKRPGRPVSTTSAEKKSYNDPVLLEELGLYIDEHTVKSKPNDEMDIKLIISKFLIEKPQETTLDPDILFYMLIHVDVLEEYSLAGCTYYRRRQKSI